VGIPEKDTEGYTEGVLGKDKGRIREHDMTRADNIHWVIFTRTHYPYFPKRKAILAPSRTLYGRSRLSKVSWYYLASRAAREGVFQ